MGSTGGAGVDSAPGEIQVLVNRLSASATAADILSSTEQINRFSNDLRELRHVFVDSAPPGKAKDAFRRANGFETIFNVILLLSARLAESRTFDALRTERFEALKCSLMTISEAAFDHPRNRQYCSDLKFWANVERHLGDAVFPLPADPGVQNLDSVYEKQNFFGILFAVALCEDSLIPMFRAVDTDTTSHSASHSTSQGADPSFAPTGNASSVSSSTVSRTGHIFSSTDFLWNPAVVLAIFSSWTRLKSLIEVSEKAESLELSHSLAKSPDYSSKCTSLLRDLYINVVLSLKNLTSANAFNAVAMQNSDVLRMALETDFSTTSASYGHSALAGFSAELLKLGLKSLNDTAYFFQTAENSQSVCETLLAGIRTSRTVPHLVFDLSMQGYASVEFSQLKSPFPPKSPSHGYSLATWIRVTDFDDSCHTTIFGAFDPSQTCFLLCYIESGTRQLVLQTSIVSKNPSVRFKSVTFQRHRWYHIAIVHHRRSSTSPSYVSLFVDGDLSEKKKCHYPEPAPLQPGGQTVEPHAHRLPVPSPVQCFFGTPQDLSPRLGKAVLSSKWELASAHLFQEVLSDDLVFVYCQMGPTYRGNFQDCLGSFQTYRASTILNLRNEERHADDSSQSIITAAVRSKAGKLNPEQNLLLSISPRAVIALHNSSQSQVSNAKRTPTVENQFNGGSAEFLLNVAIPVMAKATARPAGVGSIMGGVVLYRPFAIEDTCWRLSGCVAMALRLVAQAGKPETLSLALNIFLELVRENWRNSEAMERGSGFGVLAWMLRTKLLPDSNPASQAVKQIVSIKKNGDDSSLAENLLRTVLKFVGFNFEVPQQSTITNPLAYRQLVVDCGVWERSDQATQKLYFEQFIVFAVKSDNCHFNARRLSRMRIMKKLIDALKAGTITQDVAPLMQEAMKALLQCTVTSEVLRSLALYITYALFTNESSQARYGLRRVADDTRVDPLIGKESGIKTLQMLRSFLCESSDNARVHKFARTVTIKWLLHLLSMDDVRVTVSAITILVRILVSSGAKFLAKFEERQGFVILRRRLNKWWHLEEVWSRCWELLFGPEYMNLFLHDPRAASALATKFQSERFADFFCPSVVHVMLAMFERCLQVCIMRSRRIEEAAEQTTPMRGTKRLDTATESDSGPELSIVYSALDTLAVLHSSKAFQALSSSKHFTRDLLAVLYAATKENIETGPGTPKTRQESDFSQTGSVTGANKGGQLENRDSMPSPTMPSNANFQKASSPAQTLRIRRNSSFVMINSQAVGADAIPAFEYPLAPVKKFEDNVAFSHPLFGRLIKLLAVLLVDQVIRQQDYSGAGLFLKAPSATVEKRSSINSLVLRTSIKEMKDEIVNDAEVLHDPKVLTNLARFIQQTYEAILEGWLVQGARPLLDLVAAILSYLRSPDVRMLKSIRLCSPTICLMQGIFWRLVLHHLVAIGELKYEADPSDIHQSLRATELSKNLHDEKTNEETILVDLLRWYDLLFDPTDADDPSVSPPRSDPILLHAFCYIICLRILNGNRTVQASALKLYRSVLSQNLRLLSTIVADKNLKDVWLDFLRTVMSGPENIADWLGTHRTHFEDILDRSLKLALVQFIQRENTLSHTTAGTRVLKRDERLHQRHLGDLAEQHAWTEHDLATGPWADNICESELVKYFRSRQDQQDGQEYFEALYRKYEELFLMQQSSTGPGPDTKWSLDETEGRSRMRMRLLRGKDAQDLEYKPKRRQTIAKDRFGGLQSKPRSVASTDELTLETNITDAGRSTHGGITPADNAESMATPAEPISVEDFEIVQEVEDDLEDKNRKVMRSLQRGERVQVVYNVSRIRGLEAWESLLIIGEKSLYLLLHLFQRSDGEIVNVWQAPTVERDPYTRMITGREIKRPKGSTLYETGTGAHHWPWTEIISVSKRRFLSRPVGLEIFFQDGRSYLLTAMSENERNKLYSNLLDKAVKLRSSSMPGEDAWRVELLPDPREPPQTVGSRLASVFSLGSLLPVTTRWQKGEISNFQYLMMVNTMAGRTFNDLTQYPVFPWVIADYTSDHLDLDNPRTFRDLTKPMGCQNSHRETAFRERFQAFAEMSEHKTPAFHYGTHYSTAMIVTSYLIRLQPYVDAYLLLQGGTFDHADRLFYSIEKAWLSASQETMTDVRELTPEFFYLPDFLKNLNKYDFGSREANGEKIDHVKLPPWAKDDPEIFIAKHREALESPYVSQNLHNWIDLVFGFKQRGEAAIEAVNVFHHLSYQDATDLDTIGDGMERLATIGIIHNFGQTPAQVFSRPHERRESSGIKTKKLHQVVDSLHRLPAPVYKHHSEIVQLDYSVRQQRLLCCGPFRSFMPMKCFVVVEWGHTDNSIRFYNSESKKTLGLFEQPHQDSITSARFVDNTLITASKDCTVAVWNVNVTSEALDLQLQGYLFGHRESVLVLRVSGPLSTILSVDSSGRVLLWDLNGLDLVREIVNRYAVQYAQISSINGHIALCCDQRIVLYTLNGTLLLDQNICSHATDSVVCCSFFESSGSEWTDAELIFTGHRWGFANVWKLVSTDRGIWQLQLVRRLDHISDGRNIPGTITAICPLDHTVYTGDDEGNVFEWACPR